MTQDDILRISREAGYPLDEAQSDIILRLRAALADFAQAAYDEGAAAERKACADICDQHASVEGIAQRCAERIRARGKK